MLRVLSLPTPVQQFVEEGKLSIGHARALLALPDRESSVDVANRAVQFALSVRELEQYVRDMNVDGSNGTVETGKRAQRPSATSPDPAVTRVQDDLRRYLQTDVKINLAARERGRIEIAFYSNDDLDRILDLVLRENRKDF
jgi:ParB family chromosome partitioning protein